MNSFRVGVLTYHRGYNYGAQLQARALCNRINMESDMDCELIDYHRKKIADANTLKFFSTKRQTLTHIKTAITGEYFFQTKMAKAINSFLEDDVSPKSNPYLCTDSLLAFNCYVKDRYDIIVVGSDEIWKVNNVHGFPNPFFLIGDLGCRKFSYAASARVNFGEVLKNGNYELLKSALDDFEYIGVRDHLTYDEVEKTIDNKDKLHLNCDPSFLYDFKVPDISVDELLRKKGYSINKNKKTILVLIDERRITKEIYKQLHSEFNLIAASQYQSNMINVPDLTPIEWISLIKGVDFVISSLFHGCCFSIINGAPFMAVGTSGKSAKLRELLFEDSVLEKHYVEINDTSGLESRNLMEDLRNPRFYELPEGFISKKRSSFDLFLQMIREGKKGIETYPGDRGNGNTI